MMMLRIFENLLFALFPLSFPMYKQVYAVIKALREKLPNARATLQHNPKTCILWIILLQAQMFVQEKMVRTQGCLGEFTNMVNQLTGKKYESISHIKVPTHRTSSEIGRGSPMDT